MHCTVGARGADRCVLCSPLRHFCSYGPDEAQWLRDLFGFTGKEKFLRDMLSGKFAAAESFKQCRALRGMSWIKEGAETLAPYCRNLRATAKQCST